MSKQKVTKMVSRNFPKVTMMGVWKSRKPESGIGTEMGTGSGTGTGNGNGTGTVM